MKTQDRKHQPNFVQEIKQINKPNNNKTSFIKKKKTEVMIYRIQFFLDQIVEVALSGDKKAVGSSRGRQLKWSSLWWGENQSKTRT